MKWNKTLLRIALIVSFLAVNALLLFGISSVWSYLNTGADRSSRLHISFEQELSYTPEVIWDTTQVEGRPMEKETLSKIELDYLNGWYVKNTALSTNDPNGLADYFTDSTQTKIYNLLTFNKANGTTFDQTSLAHHPQLKFYSADGTQIMFIDYNVRLYRKSFHNGTPILEQTRTASYQVIMLLEDGFWRIRHWVEIPESDTSKSEVIPPEKTDNNSIAEIKGLNYYPKNSPWDTFGKRYNDSIVDSDFNIIKRMGLNTVRIFVPYTDFGKAEVEAIKLQNLRSLLDKASANDLKVIVTLFDFYGNYEVADWTLNHRHAKTIVKALKYHDALLAWDLKNEPDLDFDSRGKENVLAWLTELGNQIRKWDVEHSITVGWSSTEAAVHLAEEVDFVSFHYYKKLDDFLEAYQRLKKALPESKPIVLQEYGISSYGGFWKAFLGSEANQASYYETMQPLLKQENIPFIFWTLYDFEEVPTSVVGRLPWRKTPQQYYGCLDIEGREKKSFQVLSKQKYQEQFK